MGIVRDPQFGCIVMIGAGGILVEIIRDVVFAVPPFDQEKARALIERLGARTLLEGARGQGPVAVDALAEAFSNFSILASSLKSEIASFDVNPVIVNADEAVVVDALVVASEE